jgi:hypothetical protein
VISPVQASTPPEAEKLKEAAYTLLPATKITDVLLEVDGWTNFTSCFTHQRNGRACDNKPALLSRPYRPTASISASTAWPTRPGHHLSSARTCARLAYPGKLSLRPG